MLASYVSTKIALYFSFLIRHFETKIVEYASAEEEDDEHEKGVKFSQQEVFVCQLNPKQIRESHHDWMASVLWVRVFCETLYGFVHLDFAILH